MDYLAIAILSLAQTKIKVFNSRKLNIYIFTCDANQMKLSTNISVWLHNALYYGSLPLSTFNYIDLDLILLGISQCNLYKNIDVLSVCCRYIPTSSRWNKAERYNESLYADNAVINYTKLLWFPSGTELGLLRPKGDLPSGPPNIYLLKGHIRFKIFSIRYAHRTSYCWVREFLIPLHISPEVPRLWTWWTSWDKKLGIFSSTSITDLLKCTNYIY